MSQPAKTFDNPPCPYSIGYRAYNKRGSCPYSVESIEYSSWHLGYDDAQNDRHGDPE